MSNPAFQPEIFAALVNELGENDAFEVMDIFFEDTENKLKSLVARSPEKTETRREAHSIKSSAATLGFMQLSAMARELEGNAEGLNEGDLVSAVLGLKASLDAAALLRPRV